jgi:hypothetical protein
MLYIVQTSSGETFQTSVETEYVEMLEYWGPEVVASGRFLDVETPTTLAPQITLGEPTTISLSVELG